MGSTITQTFDLPLNGATTQAYLAAPEAGGPGVLVLHAWWGLTPVFKRLCHRLAAEGFVALAPDLHCGKTANTIEEAEALMNQRDSARMQEAVVAAAKVLREKTGKPIGVIGFSMGAAWAITLATDVAPEDVQACVLIYGNGEGEFSRSRASFLGHFAVNDEWEPDEYVRMTEAALRQAGRPVTFYHYDGVSHWFCEDDKPQYNAEAAALVWDRTIAFLRSALEKES
jgi:carboxymethylenebutenolidase